MNITVFSRALGQTRQNVYKTYFKQGPGKTEVRQKQMQAVKEMAAKHPGLPGTSIFHKLLEQGFKIGRDRFYALVNEGHLTMNSRRKQWKKRSYIIKPASNLVENKTFNRVYEVLFADYTEINTMEGKIQLLLIEDLVSRYITSSKYSPTCSSLPVIEALEESIQLKKSLGLKYKTILHTDKGTEFVNYAVQQFSQDNNLILSNTGLFGCHENPFMESTNKTLKHHLGLRIQFPTKEDAYNHIRNAIDNYNNERIHHSIGKRIPYNVLMSYTGKKPKKPDGFCRKYPLPGKGIRMYSKALSVKVKKIKIDSLTKTKKRKSVNRF